MIKTTEKQRISNLYVMACIILNQASSIYRCFTKRLPNGLTVNNGYYIAPMYNLLIAQDVGSAMSKSRMTTLILRYAG